MLTGAHPVHLTGRLGMKKLIAVAFVVFFAGLNQANACFISAPADCNPACDQYKGGWC
jgi:hypothetical protein